MKKIQWLLPPRSNLPAMLRTLVLLAAVAHGTRQEGLTMPDQLAADSQFASAKISVGVDEAVERIYNQQLQPSANSFEELQNQQQQQEPYTIDYGYHDYDRMTRFLRSTSARCVIRCAVKRKFK